MEWVVWIPFTSRTPWTNCVPLLAKRFALLLWRRSIWKKEIESNYLRSLIIWLCIWIRGVFRYFSVLMNYLITMSESPTIVTAFMFQKFKREDLAKEPKAPLGCSWHTPNPRYTFFLFIHRGSIEPSPLLPPLPLSPIVANLFMEHFEEKTLMSSSVQPKLWVRFVDDTFVIWPHKWESLDRFLWHLNNQFDHIKFTMEVSRKKTHTEQYLHTNSHHHLA